jgi:ABC-type branched-subunit amino acid transport system substrate-binding protein
MLDQIHAGNVQHIVGIVGWPASNQTRLAMAALGASGLPVISPTASANNLEDTAANFFAMGPSDAQQAVDLANAAATTLQAHRVLVAVDPSEQENSDSANNFSNQVILNFSATTTILGRVSYEASSLQDASGFRAVADAAISQNADLIYLVGDQRAAIFLADEVDARASQTFHQPPHILVGTQSQMTPFFGVGTDPAALAARANSGSLALLYVATLASTSHWQALNINAPDVRAFSDNFSALFGGVWGTGGLALPSSLAILSYDASNMLLAALGDDVQVKGNNVTVPTSQQLTIALRQFTVQHPFVGLGGAVGFSNSVHQPNKALGLFMLLPIPNAPDNAPVVQLQLTTVIGGKPVFCGQSACQPY